MAKADIHPKLYTRVMVQPNGKKIEVMTTQSGAKEYVLPTNLEDHPAWSGNKFGKMNEADKKNSRTKNTGADIFGF